MNRIDNFQPTYADAAAPGNPLEKFRGLVHAIRAANYWKRFAKERIEARGCPLVESPDADVLKTKVFAVHATDIFPMNGKLVAGTVLHRESEMTLTSLKPTVHFALGSLVPTHSGGSWEGKKYAVIAPLEKILPQVVNLYPYDTAALGDVRCDSDYTLLVPENEDVAEGNISIMRYSSKKTLRLAVDDYIQTRGGWQFHLEKGQGHLHSRASIQGFSESFDGCQTTMFDSLFKEVPDLSFGPIANPVNDGEAWRITLLDELTSNLYKHYLLYAKMGSIQKCFMSFDQGVLKDHAVILEHNLQKVEEYLARRFPNQTIEGYERFKKEVNIILYLMKFDLYRRERGRWDTPLMVQSEDEKVINWLENKVGELRKQNDVSHESFSDQEANVVDEMLTGKKYTSEDRSYRIARSHQAAFMLSNMSENESQIVLTKLSSTVSNYSLFNFILLLNRWERTGGRGDKNKFQSYLETNMDQLSVDFGVYRDSKHYLYGLINRYERWTPEASRARKALLEEIVVELKKILDRIKERNIEPMMW